MTSQSSHVWGEVVRGIGFVRSLQQSSVSFHEHCGSSEQRSIAESDMSGHKRVAPPTAWTHVFQIRNPYRSNLIVLELNIPKNTIQHYSMR